MEVISDAKKIINQALGRENLFGFQTTLANQFYLIHCFLGNVFFTDKIHGKTKYFWFCWHYSAILVVSFALILFPINCSRTNDILTLIYISLHLVIFLIVSIAKPAITQFWYKTDIEQMIFMADKIILKRTTNGSQSTGQLHLKKRIISIIIALWASFLPYHFGTEVDLALFYEEEKVKNYMYYVVPLCGIVDFGSLTFYMVYTSVTMAVGFPFFIVLNFGLIFSVLWVTICCNEAQRIIEELNSLSAEDVNIDSYKHLEPKFSNTIEKCIQDIRDLTMMISLYRSYFETISGFVMPTYLYILIIHAVILVSPYPPIVKIKEVGASVGLLIEVYVICWVGAKLEQLTTDLSLAVYSTPWYWLKSIRKDVYILLCQTQVPIEPMALNVYPLVLATFMRFCNTIKSVADVYQASVSK